MKKSRLAVRTGYYRLQLRSCNRSQYNMLPQHTIPGICSVDKNNRLGLHASVDNQVWWRTKRTQVLLITGVDNLRM